MTTPAFEIFHDASGSGVKASGGTRAGLLEAALKGMFAAAGPRPGEGEATIERDFAVKAADLPTLLADLLDEALKQSAAHGEVYEAVRFDLVAAAEVKGAFVGRRIEKFETVFKAARRGFETIKDETGLWRATVTFD